MTTSTDGIIECLQRLRRADPTTYEELVRRWDAYTYELLVGLAEAPTDDILVAKGHAGMARKVLQLLLAPPKGQAHKPPSP